MSRVNEFLIVNKMAPVECWVRTDLDGKRRKFKSWYEFVAWYDERHHGYMNFPPSTSEKFTDVLVDTLTDSPRRSGRRKPVQTAERQEQREPAAKGRRNQGVVMDGKPFTSLFKAFQSLGWPDDARFQKFRRELKAKLHLPYEGHDFKIAE